jgi:hypothetical protein
MLHTYLTRASRGRSRKKAIVKRSSTSLSAISDLDRLAQDLAQEWCSGNDMFRQHLYIE